jgi:hypothetical protein
LETQWRFSGPNDPADRHIMTRRLGLIAGIAPTRAGRTQERPTEEILGCAFVIGAYRRNSLLFVVACTAAHVLYELEKCLRPDCVDLYGGPFSPERGSLLPKEFRHRTAHLLVDDPTEARDALNIVAARFYPAADLAYVIAHRGSPFPATGQPLMLIDSDPIQVGTSIAIFGAPNAKVEISESDGLRSTVSTQFGWEERIGVISGILPRSRLAKSPVYETSVPAPGGMSGGPVMVINRNADDETGTGENIAIGVLSHDLPDDMPEDIHRRGQSYVIPAASMYGLPAPQVPSAAPVSLANAKLLTDVGKRWGELFVDFAQNEQRVSRKGTVLIG